MNGFVTNTFEYYFNPFYICTVDLGQLCKESSILYYVIRKRNLNLFLIANDRNF